MRIGQTIYLDHQATTPVDQRVFSEMRPYFSESFGNPHSVDHSIGWKSAQAVDKAAVQVAHLIGADKDEIIFTSGATEANNLALLGLGRRQAGGKRRRFLMTSLEHKCILDIGRALNEQLGYAVELLPVDSRGFVDMDSLKHALSEDVLAVSIMAVNNEIGTIQNIADLSEIIRDSGALFHCDAAQAPCAIDLTKFSQYADLLSLSGHKMYGPQGIGALFIRRELQERIEPLVHGGGQQRALRSGTIPLALCVGMGSAAALSCGIEAERERDLLRQRTATFVRMVENLPWSVGVNGAKTNCRHPGNANIRFEGFDAQEILNTVQPHLAASTGSACTTGIPEPSHVLKAIGLSTTEIESSIRFSLGRDSSDADIEEAMEILYKSLSKLSTVT